MVAEMDGEGHLNATKYTAIGGKSLSIRKQELEVVAHYLISLLPLHYNDVKIESGSVEVINGNFMERNVDQSTLHLVMCI